MLHHAAEEATPGRDPVPTVLIVDDRRDNLVALEAVLQPLDVRVVRAGSGLEAVSRCGQEEFAVVILDVMMPGADGLETARLLKARGAGRLTPIIFLTAATADRRRIHDGYASGAVDYLFKPVDPDLLRAKVAAFVDLYRHRRAEHWQQRRRYADQAAAAAEAAYREGEQQFRLLAQSVPAMVWTAGSGGRIDSLNAYGAEYVGAEPAAARTVRWTDHLHPDDRGRVRDGWARAVRDGAAFESEARIWSARRETWRRHIVRAEPRRDQSGAVLGWIGVNADVEDSKRTEEEAHELQLTAEREARMASDDARRELARALAAERRAHEEADAARRRVEFLSEAGAVLNQSLDYAATLQQLAELTVPFLADYAIVDMLAPDGTLRRPAVAHHDPGMRERLAATIPRVGGLPDPDHPAYAALLDGRPRLFGDLESAQADALAQLHRHHELVGAIGVRSMMVIPLQARERMLGLLILGRTGDQRYTGADLQLAADLVRRAAVAIDTAMLYEQAQEANSAKASFLAAISHELRQPLNASLGFLEIALMGLRGEVPPGLRADLERIQRNQQHLLALINDVLSFARIEAGQLMVRREVVALREVFDGLSALVTPQASARRVVLEIAACPGDICILADRDRVVQVFTNLLTNAIKATPHGGTVAVEYESGGDVVLGRVRDTGVGIPAELRDRIFEPFAQVRRALNHPEEGIGLGLSISRNLARAMGGDLTVESEVGRGSVFTLRLPSAAVTPGGVRIVEPA